VTQAQVLEVRGLGKDYGTRTAVKALDLDVADGEIVGLLGPNGAGKTTTISMICGVIAPSRGSARVAGHDIRRDPKPARAALGVVPQDLAIYEQLTARENLTFFGGLYRLTGATLRERIDWALRVVGLSDRAGDIAKTYSGGMKRRLNLAAGLLHRPRLLILDEPTVGVDPQSRNHIFETIRALRRDGMTIVYTSHYMEEVEALCDRVAIMDGGAIVAQGRIDELLARHRRAEVTIQLEGDAAALDQAAAAAAAHATIRRDGATLHATTEAALHPLLAAIEQAGARVVAIHSHQPHLEDVFLELTGHTLRDA
jgi:ABC-2 type transport system ATP-binding protein